jgi:2-(1,2-epoxy-1,2-dihydrophenyl)acetyl-CoA isomerase
MSYQFITIQVIDQIGTLTLRRPDRLNAFNGQMAHEMVLAMRELLANRSLRVVVITGAGRGFCAGADIEYMRGLLEAQDEVRGRQLVEAGRDLVNLIRRAKIPVIASVNGPAAGGGANLALACDLRIASERASFGQTFVRIGLHPDWGGLYFLPILVGRAKAAELMMTGKMIDAEEALRIGLVNRVVPHEELAKETQALAQELASGPPHAIARIKRGLQIEDEEAIAHLLDYEIEAQLECFRSKDAAEGMKAFLEKRPPHFTGQ